MPLLLQPISLKTSTFICHKPPMKITDRDYSLPVIEALSPHEIFTSGANKPLLITGVGAAGKKNDYVVKFRAAERMSNEACMRELLALFIAAEMDIKCVTPAIINISPDFVDILVGNDAWQYASQSLGYNFGSENIKGYNTILSGQDLNNDQLPFAQNIFAFDVVIQNNDRRNDKPNMMTDGHEIVIYDHELAFGFVLELFKNPEPWKIRDSDYEWISKHVLLPKIKGKDFDFEKFSKRFDTLGEAFWQTAWNLIPQNWRSDQFDTIKQYLSAICNHKDAFIIELKKLMS
jgi:hypothetical protein